MQLNHFFQANSFGPREGGGGDECEHSGGGDECEHSPSAVEILAGFMEGVEEQQAQEAKEAEERAMAEPEPEDMSELEEGVWKPWPEAKPLFSDFDDLFRKPSDERSGASESRGASIASTSSIQKIFQHQVQLLVEFPLCASRLFLLKQQKRLQSAEQRQTWLDL